MLPGIPSSGGSANSGMPPTSQSIQTPESAQHSTNSISEGPDSLLGSPRSRSHSSSYEFMQKMNCILGSAINLNSFMQDASPMSETSNQGGLRTLSGGFGGESELTTPPNRAVGSMRAIRGSGGHPIRMADPCDTTPIKQTPQLSDHLKSILSRQGHGGDFGSLITPLPVSMANSTSANSALAAAAAAYHWTPFHVYQNPADVSGYFGSLNRIDYGPLREAVTWAPLPVAPPSSSSVSNTPGPIARNSPERSASTGSSSSSGVSMSHLTDLIAQLNTNDSSPWPAQYQQSQSTPSDISREWPTVYQLRHGARPPPALPMPSLISTPSPAPPAPPPPPPIATSATNPSASQSEYAALLMAAANYINNNSSSGERVIGGGSMTSSNANLNMSHCDSHYLPPNENGQSNTTEQQYSIERAARIYRKAATICDATCTWSGQLPANLFTRCVQNVSYSCKVFVGGVPWDVTEAALLSAFTPFGPCRVEWPGKEARYAKSPVKPSAKGKGYVYMIYENERSVKALLDNCARDFAHAGEYYFQLTSRRLRTKEIRQVQIIPWNISDSNHLRFASQRLDPKKTVFVGALHGMITAEVLCNVLNDLFGGVVYAGIDTDKYKYPIGSGRVTFNNTRSYHKAIAAAFVEIKSAKFSKKVQIDPYLEDATCSTCMTAPGPYFCRELMCFRYFCKTCWHTQHALDVMQSHKPLMRNTRRNQHSQCVAAGFPNFPINNGQQF